MDTEILVNDRLDAGRELLVQLEKDGVSIRLGFWLRAEDEPWRLYLVVDPLKGGSVRAFYEMILPSISKLEYGRIDLTTIRPVEVSSPLAAEVMHIRERQKARLPIRLSEPTRLGDILALEVYIYPPQGRMTQLEILQTVAHLMNRRGSTSPSKFLFVDGTSMQAIPHGVDLTENGPTIRLHDVDANTDEPFPIEKIATIY